jgi:uncharacterized protein (TIGR03435 family)
MQTDSWAPMHALPPARDGEESSGDKGLRDPLRPTLFTIFEQQLGLKLESQKAPLEMYIIERVSRPAAN